MRRLTLFAIVLLAACGGNDGSPSTKVDGASTDTAASAVNNEPYPDGTRDQFVDECSGSGGTDDMCGCYFDTFEATTAFEDFMKIQSRIGDGAALASEPEVMSVMAQCLVSSDPTAVNGRYPAQVRDTFLSECAGGGSSMSACECALAGFEESIDFATFFRADSEIQAGTASLSDYPEMLAIFSDCG